MRIHAKLVASAFALVIATSTAHAQEDHRPDQGLTWKDIFDSKSTLKLYGFLRTDTAYNTDRFNDPQLPVFVRSPSTDPNNGHDEFTLHARMTRLGLQLNTERIDGLGNPTLAGKVEIDFYNSALGDSDSRAAMRMRHAYLDLHWDRWSLLAGQTWDVVSPLTPTVNNDFTMWGAGNTGDRRPQVTATYAVPLAAKSSIITKFGIALSEAVGGSTTNGGLTSGEASGRPMLDARVGYHGETAGGAYQIGVWGHQSKERFDATGAGEQDFDSYSLGLDFKTPLGESAFGLAGEYFMGRNLRDIRGGILQGVNGTTGREIDAQGGWAELVYEANDTLSLYAGYSTDNPDDADLSVGDPAKNSVPYLAARWRYSDLRMGLEYLNWTTDYVGIEKGQAHRVAAWISYYF